MRQKKKKKYRIEWIKNYVTVTDWTTKWKGKQKRMKKYTYLIYVEKIFTIILM